MSNTVEIRAPRGKLALYLVVSLLFVAGGFWSSAPFAVRTVAVIFFGKGVVVFAWQLLRPMRLILDDEGFALAGGFVRSPKKVYWRDIGGFLVYRVFPLGPKMIGFNYKPCTPGLPAVVRFNRRLGAEAALPILTASPEATFERLNAYLARAR